jgi:hypothetical protein
MRELAGQKRMRPGEEEIASDRQSFHDLESIRNAWPGIGRSKRTPQGYQATADVQTEVLIREAAGGV